MNTYQSHKLADIFPLMSEREFSQLVTDIRENGLLEPVWLYEGKILDGRNRFNACMEVGVEVETRQYNGDNPVAFVVSLNLSRRHLRESQRADVAARLADMTVGQPEKNTANLPNTSVPEAAEMLSVSERSVTSAKKVQKEGVPELQEKLSEGSIAVSTAASVAALEPEEQEEIIEEINAGEKPAEVLKKHTHVSKNTGENEWYTPVKFIDSARLVMGSIDLDPASCEQANETVRAAKYYTKQDSGLDATWSGNVWMNPPYAQPLMGQFAQKIADEVENIDQAIVLVNNATETKWFQVMLSASSAVCFPSSRIKFIDQEGKSSGAPLQGQAILYFGDNAKGFVEQFSQYGGVLTHA